MAQFDWNVPENPIQPASRPSNRVGIACLLILVVLLWIFVGGRMFSWGRYIVHRNDPTVVVPRANPNSHQYHWMLHSNKPNYEVRVPFTYSCHELAELYKDVKNPYYGVICFYADVDGKKIPCVLDTGAAGICWPQYMALHGERGSERTMYKSQGINNSERSEEHNHLPALSIGGYELNHLCTWQIIPNGKQHGVADVVAIVGNFAVGNIVLTIDYRHKMLTFRDPKYNIQLLPKRKEDVLLDFTWQNGVPIVQGKLNGLPAHFLIDTGSNTVCVTQQFAAKNLQKRKRSYYQNYGAFGPTSGSGRLEKGVRAEVGAEAGLCRFIASNIVGVPGDYDGIIGQPLLEFYDVTIDYPRRKVLLHGNGFECLPEGGLR